MGGRLVGRAGHRADQGTVALAYHDRQVLVNPLARELGWADQHLRGIMPCGNGGAPGIPGNGGIGIPCGGGGRPVEN